MEERSVTRAAERLCISQPAMSKILNRLRVALDDQLFDSTRQGLVPTRRATELSFPVSNALAMLASGIFEADFKPADADCEITIQIPDVFSMSIIPHLYARLLEQAPGVRLKIENNTDNYLELLAAGKIDFAIYVEQKLGEEFRVTPLGACPPVCLMRDGHPLTKLNRLSMSDISNYPMVSMIYDSYATNNSGDEGHRDVVQQFLTDYRFEETSGLRTRQILSAMAALLETDAVLLGPYMPLSIHKGEQSLIAKRIELISEDFKAQLVVIQHHRTQNSHLHNWLRAQLLESWTTDLPV